MYIAIDFDSTICKQSYLSLGDPIPDALRVIKRLQDSNYKLILWTVRSGHFLTEAVNYLVKNEIKLYAVNDNPMQKWYSTSKKVSADIYIDNNALGCPLIKIPNEVSFVDWATVEKILEKNGIL